MLLDFTLNAYEKYLRAIKTAYANIYRFDDFFSLATQPGSFCLIRHDIDRRPMKALQMALLEKQQGICATYYFRSKAHTFKPRIIRKIAAMGHEVGYHYECLSDAKGDIERAIIDFENNLKKFQNITLVKTIAMHGRPLSPFDNLDMWRVSNNHFMLNKKYGVKGEVYLDIDYREIAYINDTGRNWTSTKANKRDIVKSDIKVNIESGNDLYNCLKEGKYPKIIFQVHPERWSTSIIDFYFESAKDYATNFLKLLF